MRQFRLTAPMLAGDGTYSRRIVSEAGCQAQLQSICGGPARDVELECLPLLVIDYSNPQYRMEVQVEILGRHVGNLSRSDAAVYRQAMAHMRTTHEAFACRALIVGGPHGRARGLGSCSVQLDLLWPPRPLSAAGVVGEAFLADALTGSALRPRRRLWTTFITGALTSVAIVFAAWNMPSNTGGAAPSSSDENVRIAAEPAEPLEAPKPEVILRDEVSACPDGQTTRLGWEILQDSGVVKSVAPTGDLAINEALWDDMPPEDKQRFAMAGYCHSTGADGAGSILVVGANDRRLRGSVVNGRWLNADGP